MAKKTPESIQVLLRSVIEHFEQEDTETRDRQIKQWRQLKYLWDGVTRTWYSEVAHDWRVYDWTEDDGDGSQSYYDKPVNIFRAYLESIIAALSITVPPVSCYPDDADNNLDIQTAKAGDQIAKQLYRHNNAQLLWLHMLFIFCTEGLIAVRVHKEQNDKFGTFEEKKYREDEEQYQVASCPSCGHELSSDPMVAELNEKLELADEMQGVDDTDVPIQDYLAQEGDELCPACGMNIVPQLSQQTLTVTKLIGVTKIAKTRVLMNAYGGLNVRVPNYARDQKECPYLFYTYETHYSLAMQEFGELDGNKLKDGIKASAGERSREGEEWARISTQYRGNWPENVVSVRHRWLRPGAFNVLNEEDCATLQKKYPNGAHVVLVQDQFAYACNEDMDDSWKLSYNPLADHVHYDPLGLLLVSLQELTNDLISLITQTIEQGIGQTFADPAVLNFDAYRQQESTPGGVYEAVPKSGKSLSDGFHEMKTAQLSGEVLPFFQQLQTLAQLVSGALPSLFGGAMAGSETASQYSMSRAQALQRLQNTWKMLTTLWKETYSLAIPAYIEEVLEDERNVEKTKEGRFINTFIRKAELEGKIGRVELEANENLPITWSQRKDVIMQLLEAGRPEILAILGNAENLPIIREAIGLDDFFVPGEEDRNKQYEEINELLNSTPMMNPEDGQEMPSVEVNFDFDNHEIEFEVCRKWITSEAGRIAKIENEAGYQNVMLHALMHKQAMMEQMPPPMAPDGSGEVPLEQPNAEKSTPITGESDVQAT